VSDAASLTLDELREKVGRGITWLSEHDPQGHFYFHYLANKAAGGSRNLGLDMKPPKNWDAAKVDDYRKWESALIYWLELDKLLEKRERQEANSG
jgi:hypothetical protein